MREAAHEPLLAFAADRLRRVSEAAAKPWVDVTLDGLEAVRRRVAGWPALPAAERELEARPVADTLYHLLAASLLLSEGQALLEARGDAHTLFTAALYLKRWLAPRDPTTPAFGVREIEWLDALADWTPVPLAALEAVPGAR